jgi:hydrogenase maturation factor
MKCQSTNSGTVVCCIDGRIQIPVVEFLRNLWNVEWVDVVTEIAPERLLSDGNEEESVRRIHENITASLVQQLEARLAVASHSGCDCNNVPDEEKREMVRASVRILREAHQDASIIGVWVDETGTVSQL